MNQHDRGTMDTRGMKVIGRGAFSTVYRSSKRKVLIKSEDHVKECMSMGWFPLTPMFPVITKVGMSGCGRYSFYEERYYKKVSSLKNNLTSFEWEFYKVLKNLVDYKHPDQNSGDLFTDWHSLFDTIPNKFWRKRELLKEALDALANYGSDICFEISPRNVAVRNKKLVLLDCFFFKSQLKW